MSKTNLLEDLVIGHIFRTATFTKPTTVYIALYTAATDAEGNSMTEVGTTNTAYQRVAVTVADANWAATSGTDGKTSNVSDVVFPTPTGGTNWGTVTHFGICASATEGASDAWYINSLTATKVINSGDQAPKFSAGTLIVIEG